MSRDIWFYIITVNIWGIEDKFSYGDNENKPNENQSGYGCYDNQSS